MAKWVIALDLPHHASAAFEAGPSPEVSFGRLRMHGSGTAVLANVISMDSELHIVIPLYGQTARAWLRDALRVGALTFVSLGADPHCPRGIHLDDLSGLRRVRLPTLRSAVTNPHAGEYEPEIADAIGTLMAKHTIADLQGQPPSPDRVYVAIHNEGFTANASRAMDRLVAAWLDSELVPS